MAGSIPVSPTAEPVASASGLAPGGWRRARGTPLLGRVDALVGVVLVSAFVLLGLFGPALAPTDPLAPTGPSLDAPSAAHPMGTDALGRDLFSGVLAGARTSLVVVVGTVLMASVIGMTVGTIAGYRGGRLDDAFMRVTELFQVLPRFFLAIVVIAMFGPGLDRLVLVLGLTSWPVLGRVLRAEVLSLRRRAFVEAAIALGASERRVLVRTILPNAMPAATVYLGLLAAQVLLLEASLGFLGLGDPNAISWGYLAGQAQRFLRVAWWLSFFPGLAIAAAVLGMNLLGDAITDRIGGRTERGHVG